MSNNQDTKSCNSMKYAPTGLVSAEETADANQNSIRVHNFGIGSGDIETIITNAIDTSNIVTV